MKKLVVLAIMAGVLMFPVAGMCDFVSWNCTPAADNITSGAVQLGTAAAVNVPAVMSCGTQPDRAVCTGTQRTLCYDISSLNGTYSIKGLVRNAAGVASPWSVPFTFAVSNLSAPTGARLVK